MAVDRNVPEVLAHWVSPSQIRRIEPHSGTGGFSGSQLWRVTTDDGRDLCLRRWPREHPTPERLRLIHAVLTHAAASGITFIPAPLRTTSGQTFVEQVGRLWELVPWLPGAADYLAKPSRPRLAAAFTALARFHTASSRPPLPLGEGWGEGLPTIAPAPAFIERHDLVNSLLNGDFDRLTRAVGTGLSPALDHCAQRILNLASDRLALLQPQLTTAAGILLPMQPAIRDIHHEHILFTGDQVTGVIDFGALRIDTPLTDVARLSGSLAGDDREAVQFALNAYHRLWPLSARDRQLVDLLDASGVVLGGLNWLCWLYLERREFGDLAAVVRRLDEIAVRLEFRPHSGGR